MKALRLRNSNGQIGHHKTKSSTTAGVRLRTASLTLVTCKGHAHVVASEDLRHQEVDRLASDLASKVTGALLHVGFLACLSSG